MHTHTYSHTHTNSHTLICLSAVVLSQSSQRSAATNAAIESFLAHTAWIRVVAERLLDLHKAGHIKYRSFRVVFALSSPWQIVNEEAARLESELRVWAEDVQEARETFPLLNSLG